MILLIMSLPFIFAEEFSRLYDANGNLVYDSETDIYRQYNELNQLIRTRQNNLTGIILQEYTWEPIQERIFIKDEFYSNGSLKSSTYYFGDDYVVIQNSSGTYNQTYIYQDGVLVGYEDVDGKKRYILPDHEGSVHIVLNESGNVIEENLFSPFAESLDAIQESRFSYEAKEYDSLVKDYDFHFRKLGTTGPPIFTQPDTLIQNVYDPQELNRYTFERNNPYKYLDPDGHGKITFFLRQIEKVIHRFVPFARDVAISETVSRFTDKQKEKYEETVPEEEQSQFVEDVYQFTRLGSDTVTVTQGGMVAKARTRHVYLRNIYKTLDYIGDVGLIVDALLGGYYAFKTYNYNLNNPNIKNIEDNSNKAMAASNSQSSGGSGGGTSTLGSNSIQQVIKSAGGSTLKNAAQRAASESIAASIISRQRAKASSSSR